MIKLKQLNDIIVTRTNANLKEFNFDTSDFVSEALDLDKMMKFYAFYGITSHHPIYFHFQKSNMAGSYFLGKCYVRNSTVYKSDIRGDELKREGDHFNSSSKIPIQEDEMITIRHSLLYKTLVHSNSHNPEIPEEFMIRNTISAHYANIHGTTLEGCFLGPFATVDLMALHSCIVGEYCYLQTGELFHKKIDPGTVWVKNEDFEFRYQFNKETLDDYVGLNESHQPRGIIYDFTKQREPEYDYLFDVIKIAPMDPPRSSAISKYAVIKGDTKIGGNVLISQRAFLDNAEMGDGSNAQENSYIINSTLNGLNVTAHGGKIINASMGQKVFVGFNSFLSGKKDQRLTIEKECIIMPHTIIDIDKPLTIPSNHLVWGFIRSEEDLVTNSISIDKMRKIKGPLKMGNLNFNGDGSLFIKAFQNRINHILEANGAYYDGAENRGHAQDDQNIAFNTIQPYRTGENKGIFPSIRIRP